MCIKYLFKSKIQNQKANANANANTKSQIPKADWIAKTVGSELFALWLRK